MTDPTPIPQAPAATPAPAPTITPQAPAPVAHPPAPALVPAVVQPPADLSALEKKIAEMERSARALMERAQRVQVRSAIRAAGVPEEHLGHLTIPFDGAWFGEDAELSDTGRKAINDWIAKLPPAFKQVGGTTPGGGAKGAELPQTPEIKYPQLAAAAKTNPLAAQLLARMP